MSLFRIVKYSSILFFLSKYKNRLFRVFAVLLFAGVTSILYEDVAVYLQKQHPGTVIYALVAKIVVVYGALAFVLWQFRPVQNANAQRMPSSETDVQQAVPGDRLSGLEDVSQKQELRSRYDRIVQGKKNSRGPIP
jgi:hypothetical protein